MKKKLKYLFVKYFTVINKQRFPLLDTKQTKKILFLKLFLRKKFKHLYRILFKNYFKNLFFLNNSLLKPSNPNSSKKSLITKNFKPKL